MNELKKTSDSFDRTLKDTDLQDVTGDLAEAFADSLLEDGILKDIPVVGSIIGLTRTAFSIKDRLFIKKILYFLSQLKDIDPKRREKMISDIDDSNEYKVKVGEKLLYIIDKCDDYTLAKYLGEWFRAFLDEKINYSDFQRGAKIMQNIFLADFEKFLELKKEDIENTASISGNKEVSEFQSNLINVNLCKLVLKDISDMEKRTLERINSELSYGFNRTRSTTPTIISITEIGHLFKDYFSK